MISKNHYELFISLNDFCDITNSILWYHKIRIFDITKSFRFFYIKKLILWYQTNGISDIKNRFCDITKSDLLFDITKSNLWYQKMILWYHSIAMMLWYQKVYFVISKNNFYISVLWKNDSSRKYLKRMHTLNEHRQWRPPIDRFSA